MTSVKNANGVWDETDIRGLVVPVFLSCIDCQVLWDRRLGLIVDFAPFPRTLSFFYDPVFILTSPSQTNILKTFLIFSAGP